MESKLQSLKVAELKSLLTSAGLAVSGNKPDLIQRLLENPGATASLDAGAAAESAPVAAPAPTAAAPTAAPPTAAPPTAAAPTQAVEPTPPPEQFNNTTSSSESEDARRQALIVELEKRKARAAKFGQPLGEAEQKLERAIKFGLDAEDAAGVAKLAQPLGAKPSKERKQRNEKEAKGEVKKKEESEEEKQERLKRVEEEKEKARRRAERFGLSVDGEGDKKRKAEGGAATNGEKKVKA